LRAKKDKKVRIFLVIRVVEIAGIEIFLIPFISLCPFKIVSYISFNT